MKKRSIYWWIFVTSGAMWAIAIAGMITGMLLYPESNLLGGFGPLFWLPNVLGSNVFLITLVVWLIHKTMKWIVKRRACTTQDSQK